jgi:hypothetical protein
MPEIPAPSEGAGRVVLVGLGTLGSVVFVGLVRSLAGAALHSLPTMYIIDPDTIQTHNLSKSLIYQRDDVGRLKVQVAREWARQVKPDMAVVAIAERVEAVGLGPFRGATIVVSAVDNYRGRMAVSRAAWQSGVPIILVGGLTGGESGAGRCQRFIPGVGRPCLECGWSREYELLDNSFSCGRANGRGTPTQLAPALRAGSLIVEEMGQALLGRLPDEPAELRIDPVTGVRRLRPVYNPACLFDHQVLAPVMQLGHGVEELSLVDAFALADQFLGSVAEALWLRQPVATAFECPGGHGWRGWQRLDTSVVCPTCGGQGFVCDVSWRITRRSGLESPPRLANLVPPGDVLTFTEANGREAVHLALAPPESWPPEPQRQEVSYACL